ncbi:DUF1572 domain-containing protein [Lederbergia panacisoli]|uniref:DUF1572 domain-containing protein n=1 Tax=Lederbergia panacisoli TaxID=1255251 RepID=UPI00214B94FC|nr:DUF1572 domain-containing protein [Lederbergia panacisoli]MCR2822799.1 DUF1572 domain-containing protein [Lederbergia panacisoli]
MCIGTEYIRVVIERFKSIKSLGDKTIEQLSEGDIHWRLNEDSNSISIIAKHLSGNMISRWTDFFSSDGEKPDRNREQEFEDETISKREMIEILEKGWNTLFETLESLKEGDLLKDVYIRGERHLVIDAIERQVAHYSYHIGQMVYIGKQIKSENWESLSIPKGKSEVFLQEMLKRHQKK